MDHHWIIKAPFYLRKPHDCPECGCTLRVDRREKIIQDGKFQGQTISSRSPDGKVKVHWKEFWCDTCQRHFTIAEIKRHEGIPL